MNSSLFNSDKNRKRKFAIPSHTWKGYVQAQGSYLLMNITQFTWSISLIPTRVLNWNYETQSETMSRNLVFLDEAGAGKGNVGLGCGRNTQGNGPIRQCKCQHILIMRWKCVDTCPPDWTYLILNNSFLQRQVVLINCHQQWDQWFPNDGLWPKQLIMEKSSSLTYINSIGHQSERKTCI